MRVQLGINDTNWGIAFARFAEQPEDVSSAQRYLDEAAAAGYTGIELTAAVAAALPADHADLRAELDERGLTIAGAVTSGALADPEGLPRLEQRIREFGELLPAFGAVNLALIEFPFYVDVRSRTLLSNPQLDDREWAQLVETVARAGALAHSLGLQLCVHPHADSHIETEDQIQRLLADTDLAHVRLCLDTGHLLYRGIDPVTFIQRHHERIGVLHLKNLDTALLERTGFDWFSYVDAVRSGATGELQRGAVDFPAVRDALAAVNYQGWAIVELDRLPDMSNAPLHAATAARRYLEELGFTQRS